MRRGVRHLDAPAGLPRWGPANHDVAAGLHQRASDAVPPEHLLGTVRGVALADAAKVKLHAGDQQLGRAVAGVELQFAPTHQGHGALELFRSRELLGLAGSAPQRHSRADGNVEGPVAAACHILGALQHTEQVGANANRWPAGLGAQAHQLAVRAVVAHNVIQLRKATVGRGPRGNRGRLVPGVQHQAHINAHVVLLELKSLQ